MNKLYFLLLLVFANASAQDSILTFRGKRFPAQILSKTGDSIRYKRPDYDNNKEYVIARDLVSEVKHPDGTSDYFFTDAEKARSLDELKTHICEMINQYACDEDSDRKRFVATFEGDFIRLAHAKKGEVFWQGYLYDFAKVYQFHPVSERGKTDAYINIYIDFRSKPKRNKWEKIKLIMKVDGHKEAHDIMRSLQYLNRLLLDKKKAV